MSSVKSFAQRASALAFGIAALAGPALADDSHYSGVKAMDVFLPNAVPEITIGNIAANHLLANLDLAIQETTIAVVVGGYVECLGTVSENWKEREGYALKGGAFGLGRTSLLMSKALPSSSSIDHVQDMDAHTFQMPAALLGNPQIGVNPIAAVLAAAEQAPDRLAWLRQDHVLTVKIPLRWEAECARYTRNKITKLTIYEGAPQGVYGSYLTKDVELKIKYEGDPQLYAVNVNAQLGQGQGLPDQLDGGYQPFKLTSMQFQSNMPHHIGACPAKTTIRLQYEGLGRGTIQLAVYDGGKMIDGPHYFLYEAKNGEDHYYFDIETPKPAASDLNKTVPHNLSVKVRTKDWKAQAWEGGFTQMDTAIWNHRCTPQVNPVIGGTSGGKVGGYQSGGSGNGQPKARVILPAQPQPTSPTRVAPRTTGDPAAPAIRRAQ